MQEFHVTGVGGVTVEHFRCPGNAAHDLSEWRVLQVGQAGSRLVFPEPGQKEIPQTLRAGLGLEYLYEGDGVLALTDFLLPLSDPWDDVPVQEGPDLGP
jgi:hypothetical protein